MKAKLSELKKQVFIRFILAFIFIGLTLFLPAGTLELLAGMDILRRYFYSSDLCAFLFSKERPGIT